jgi:hypothetical protein
VIEAIDVNAAQKPSADVVPIVARSNGIDRIKSVRPHTKTKSRQTNHVDTLAQVDGRLALARRFKDIINAIIIDAGGPDQCSESKVQLIRRFAAVAVIAEQMEAKLANGEQIDIAGHSLLVSTMTRIASRIGIDRRSRNVTPSLSDYLASKRDAEPEPEDAAECHGNAAE